MIARRYEGIGYLLSILIICFIVAVAAYLWSIDLLTGQRVFGVLLSAVLLAFSMLIYVYRKPNYKEMSKLLLVLGYLVLVILLSVGIALSMGYVV
jgi:peptidoglycan/LPS O-acetylase OafA/YrhL